MYAKIYRSPEYGTKFAEEVYLFCRILSSNVQAPLWMFEQKNYLRIFLAFNTWPNHCWAAATFHQRKFEVLLVYNRVYQYKKYLLNCIAIEYFRYFLNLHFLNTRSNTYKFKIILELPIFYRYAKKSMALKKSYLIPTLDQAHNCTWRCCSTCHSSTDTC